ncbi:MAG: hypothetical protein MUE40_04085 [Anaerolineae bacterium]|jgi:hypothetical protein|nr:hypothetical protein [Anaerolineae bacterium]
MAAFPRQPYGEIFHGVIVMAGEAALLASAAPPEVEIAHHGTFTLRYGIEFLGKPQFSIVPALIALDYGEVMTDAVAAWDFLFKRSNLYPRADVIGYRNDGVDEMIPVKKLDLMQPVVVLAYADAAATRPLAQVAALIAPDDSPLPPWLAQYARRYPALAAWQREHP